MRLRTRPGSAWVQQGGVERQALEGPKQGKEPPASSPPSPLYLGSPRTPVTVPLALSCFTDERNLLG